MTLASEVETIGALLKKYYESGEAKKQFFNDLTLLSRVKQKRNNLIGAGGTVTVGLHTGRNPTVGSAANGGATPSAGKQTFKQTTAELKYLYGATQFTGPDMVNSSNNKGAFANVMTANMTGMLDDMKADLNRSLFSDGSGALCFATADQDGSFIIAIEPYLWADANKYIVNGGQLDEIDYADGTTQLSADTKAGAILVASSTSTAITGTSAEVGTGKDGDLIGKHGSLQRVVSNVVYQYETMGLWGGIHDTDPIGSASYAYDTDNSVTNFTGPEGQSHDWTIAGVANTFQGLATASNSFWKSKVWGNGGVPRALTFKLLDDAIGYLKVTQGSQLSAMYTTWQVQNKLIDLLRADRRYSGEMMTLDGGLKVNSYQGIPIIISNDCPRGTIFCVDESQLSFYVGKDFGFIEAQGNPLVKLTGYDGFEVTGASYQQLAFHNRNKHGKIIDILQ